MKIDKIKEKMILFTDFAGFDISDVSAIKNAKTRDALRYLLDQHKNWVELSYHVDHIRSIDNFIKELGI